MAEIDVSYLTGSSKPLFLNDDKMPTTVAGRRYLLQQARDIYAEYDIDRYDLDDLADEIRAIEDEARNG